MSGSRGRKIAKGAGYAVAALAGLLLLAVVVVSIPAVRARILSEAISQADAHIPGTLSVRHSHWGFPLTLAVDDVAWTDGPDTLLAAKGITLALRPLPLLRGDVKVSNFSIDGLTGDVPAARARLASTSLAPPQPNEKAAAPSGSGFPRAGSVPGVPSIAVERLSLTARSLRLSQGAMLDRLEAAAAVDFSHGHPPHARLDRLALAMQSAGPAEGFTVRDASLEWDLESGTVKGHADGALSPDLPFYISITPAGESKFDLLLVAAPDRRPPQDPGLALSGSFERSGYLFSSLRYEGVLMTPGTDELSKIPAVANRLAGLGPLEGLLVKLNGSLALRGGTAASLRASIERNSWLDGGRVALDYRGGRIAVDTLLVELPDLVAMASGALSNDTMSAQADVHVSGTRWLHTLRPDASAPDSLLAEITAHAQGETASPTIDASLVARARYGGFALDNLDLKAHVPGGHDKRASVTLEARAMEMIVTADAAVDLAAGPTVSLSPIVVSDVAGAGGAGSAPGAGGSAGMRASGGGRAAVGGPGAASRMGGAAPGARGSGAAPGEGTARTKAGAPARVGGSASGAVRGFFPSGLVKYEKDKGVVTLEAVRMIGSLGDLRVDGAFGRQRPGSFHVRWAWPQPPAVLARALSPAQMDSLRAAWAREKTERAAEEPFALELQGTLAPQPGGPAIDCAGKLRLPGPRTLSALLPAGAKVGDLGPVIGSLHVKTTSTAGGRTYSAGLDLGETDWIDFGRAELSTGAGITTIDTLGVALEGFDIGMSGSLRDGQWDARANLDLSDARLLRRFYPGLGQDLKTEVSANADFQGTPSAPRLLVSTQASLATPAYSIPKLTGQARWDESGFAAKIDAPDGLVTRSVTLDKLTATYEAGPDARGLFPGDVRLALRGPDIELLEVAEIDNPDGWHVHTDTLALALSGRDLKNQSPFDFLIKPSERMLAVRNLNLQGSLGSVSAEGYSCPDSCSMHADASVKLPAEPPFKGLPPGLWPDGLDLSLTSSGMHKVSAKVDVTGIDFGDRRDLEAHLDLSTISQGITATITIADGGDNLLQGEASLPASVTLYPPNASFDKGAVRLDATLTGFPAPLQDPMGGTGPEGGRNASLDGTIKLRGTTDAPVGNASATLSFPKWPKLSKYHVDFEAQVAPQPAAGAGAGAGEGAGARTGAQPGPGQGASGGAAEGQAAESQATPGFTAQFSLAGPKGELMKGDVSYPTALTLTPPALSPIEGQEMEVRVDSDYLPLEEFDNLLPPNVGLDGACKVAFHAIGPIDNPDLDGDLVAKNLKVSLENGTRVTSSGEVKLSGTKEHPAVKGGLEILNGVIRIPEKRKELLPAQGEAVLWQDNGPLAVQSGGPPEKKEEREENQNAGVAPQEKNLELDVTVTIPSGLWIRGQGLDVELAGDLHLIQKEGYPTVAGDLQAIGGRLVFLGRAFQVDRGRVVFYGGDEIDPTLDLVLSTTVEGTVISVTLGGTAHKPELSLSSNPELPEGDIMSLLVFGRPVSELDNEQVSLLGRRAADIATAFGAVQLETVLSQQLGVDLVSINRGSGQEGGASLIIGKYLSPRVLLKYEQELEDRARFFVNLEYFLTNHFRIETLIGHQNQSAIEFNWTKEYGATQ